MKTKNYYDWVYEVTKQIPKGRVTTYGHIADYLALGSARMVGYALSQLGSIPDVPAHRVVNHKGELSGRHQFRPPQKMQDLLEREGVKVINHRVYEFTMRLWVPAKELKGQDVDL
ncbi:MAG: MGMT family protein [Saprospiraceae bacterium]|nr:MGMT family protein [Saprospiraceae bacterium]